jgi:hypothetical protein
VSATSDEQTLLCLIVCLLIAEQMLSCGLIIGAELAPPAAAKKEKVHYYATYTLFL